MKILLSALEKSCLEWLSQGKKVYEISLLEGKSVIEVEICLGRTLIKLEARSIEDALSKASALDILQR